MTRTKPTVTLTLPHFPRRLRGAGTLPAAALALCLSASPQARADEGMWPFNMVPKEQIAKDHGVAITDAWLDHLRLASVRFSSGGSGSFISPKGLVLTNHHVASDCIAKLASSQKDYLEQGYAAGKDGPEALCPDLELSQLTAIQDVTDSVRAAKKDGMSDADANVAMKGVMAGLEKACSEKGGPGVRCDVVTLYAGGKYQLYSYKKYTDVRLVFAPEQSIGFFGGDPDNFNYPRFDLDMAIFRVYENGQPLAPKEFLSWNASGPKEGDAVFVSGHPGGTDRMDALSELARLRDLFFPYYLDQAKRDKARIVEYGKTTREAAREVRKISFSIDNGYKAIAGELAGLLDPVLMKKKSDDEASLRKAIVADPKLQAAYGSVWDDIERAEKAYDSIFKRYMAIERGANRSDLFFIARSLVRLPKELALPNDKRLTEYRDAKLETLRLHLFSTAPIYGGIEAALLGTWFDRMARDLGPNDPLLKKVLAGRTPRRAAEEIVAGSRLTDIYARRKLDVGGQNAVDGSTDPMIELVAAIDDDARLIRKRIEDEVEAPMRTAGQRVAQAVFAIRGTSVYPDATFSLRLSPGVVKGYTEKGKAIGWATNFAGLYAHATGVEPFKLPQRWVDKKAALKLDTPLNFVSTNDIIGGNSGSPVVNAKGELVGLVFDGNLPSLPNRFVYGEVTQRAVSVDTAGILEALSHVFGASALVAELLGTAAPVALAN